jgi:hypothetical protein
MEVNIPRSADNPHKAMSNRDQTRSRKRGVSSHAILPTPELPGKAAQAEEEQCAVNTSVQARREIRSRSAYHLGLEFGNDAVKYRALGTSSSPLVLHVELSAAY